MDTRQPRRTFVKTSAQILAGAAALPFGVASAAPGGVPGAPAAAGKKGGPAPKALPFKISLAEWSLHRSIFGKQIDHLDFAKTANGLGFDAVEYVNQFFKDKAKDRAYLADMKNRAAGEGVWSVLIMIDGEGRMGEREESKRKETVENHRKWIDAAAFLGCHTIRVNAATDGSLPPEEQGKLAADGLRKLTEVGDAAGISVIVENHGGLSSNGAWLADVIKRVDHKRCGTLPDFGNFRIKDGEEYDRYKGVEELMPFAKSVSAKSYAFDAKGNETKIDYARMMKIVLAAGYHGYCGVEFEGKDLPEIDGILATKRLLERVRSKVVA